MLDPRYCILDKRSHRYRGGIFMGAENSSTRLKFFSAG